MNTRVASCGCGQLRATCQGEPVRVAICHCLECQKRTGSIFGTQARFERAAVKVEGRSAQWTRIGDSGQSVTFNFCPVCGSTVYWDLGVGSGFIAVAVGAFADPKFPAPVFSVYEERMHAWAFAAGTLAMEHMD